MSFWCHAWQVQQISALPCISFEVHDKAQHISLKYVIPRSTCGDAPKKRYQTYSHERHLLTISSKEYGFSLFEISFALSCIKNRPIQIFTFNQLSKKT